MGRRKLPALWGLRSPEGIRVPGWRVAGGIAFAQGGEVGRPRGDRIGTGAAFQGVSREGKPGFEGRLHQVPAGRDARRSQRQRAVRPSARDLDHRALDTAEPLSEKQRRVANEEHQKRQPGESALQLRASFSSHRFFKFRNFCH